MPRFEPFRALRYADPDLEPLLAPPYDVLDDADVDALQTRSEHNITRVDVPRGGDDRYAVAARTLAAWVADQVLVLDPEPSFTIYRLRFADAGGTARDVAGVLGALEVVDAPTGTGHGGGVLPHERTTPKDSTDRLELTRATRANLSPVWGLSLASGLAALLAEPGEPVGRLVDESGDRTVEHVWERVSDPARVAAVRDLLASDDVLVADGHHRYAVSRTYRDEVRAATGRDDTAAELTLAFVAELVADQLSVEAIHRLYAGVDADTLRTALGRSFVLTPTASDAGALDALVAAGELVLLTADGAWRLDPRPGAFDGVRALDGVWLETALAGVDATTAYRHGLGAAIGAVADGEAVAAVLVRPVSLAEIERTAREGLLMPPKSTFFTPKLKTGAVLRPLDV